MKFIDQTKLLEKITRYSPAERKNYLFDTFLHEKKRPGGRFQNSVALAASR